MKLRAQVAHVAQIGELTELRLVATGNHVAEFNVGQEVEVTVTAVPVERPATPMSRFHLFALLFDESKTLSERGDDIWAALADRPVPSPPPKER